MLRAMVGYIVIGSIGLAIVMLSLVIGEVMDGVFEAFDLDGGGLLSTPVIGSFLAAFGFGAALLMYGAEVSAGIGALGGLGSGVVVGGVAFAITRSLINMPTDAPVRTADLVGKPGTVVTRIPEGGLGEVTVNHAGQHLKLNARAGEPLAAGVPVVVTAVTSTSSVVVRRA